MRNYLLLIFSVLTIHGTGSCQFITHMDTMKLHSANFKDSLAVKKLIDTIYEHKEENPALAIQLAEYAYHRASSLKNDDLKASALNLEGAGNSDLNNYERALKLHYQALRLFERSGNLYGQAMTTNNIGRVYTESGKINDAITYLSKAEALARKNKLDKVLLFVYSNSANAYSSQNQLKKALTYALRADSLNKFLRVRTVQVINTNNIGALYYFLNDLPNALRYYQQSKQQALAMGDSAAFSRAIINIGEVYERNHEQNPLPYYQQALKYSSSAREYAIVEYVCNDISNYYKARGNYELALDYYKQSVSAREKHKNLQSAKNMALIQTQYETEKKEQRITLLNKENIIQRLAIEGRNKTIGLILGLIALLAIVGIFYANRRQLQQKALRQQQQLAQQDLLTKAVIEAEEKERKRIASDLHDGVGQLFSAVRMNLNGLFDRVKPEREEDRFLAEKTMALVEESCKEVRVISHQMMPNMLLRSGIASDVKSFIEKLDSESLKVNLEANGFKNKLESNVETVLYRVIQETVNNVIKHSKATSLDIFLNRDHAGIKATIADNGIGFNTALLKDYEGIGLKNIAARIDYLKGTVEYTSSPGKGTRVMIWVPLD